MLDEREYVRRRLDPFLGRPGVPPPELERGHHRRRFSLSIPSIAQSVSKTALGLRRVERANHLGREGEHGPVARPRPERERDEVGVA